MFKKIITVILIFSFQHCLAQADPVLPITVHIKVDKVYDVAREKASYDWEMKKFSYQINTDSSKQKYYDITIEIKDTSDKPVKIWMMTCSWEQNFLVNNNYMRFKQHDCLRNFPGIIELKPGESKVYKTTLLKSITFDYIPGRDVEATKLGLIIVNDVFDNNLNRQDYHLYMADKSKWRIVWSNALYLVWKNSMPNTL